jgi:cell division control protein 45
MRKIKRQNRKKFHNYYRGQFFGKSCAYLIYELGRSLNRETKDFLWYRVLGLTDLFINCKIGMFDYDEEIGKCNEEV